MCEKNNFGARWRRLEKQQFRCEVWQVGHETIRDVYLNLSCLMSGNKIVKIAVPSSDHLAPRAGPLKAGNLHIGDLCNELKLFTPTGRLFMWTHFCCSCCRYN